MKKQLGLCALTLSAVLCLVACGGQKATTDKDTGVLPDAVEHEGQVIDGGILRYALVSSNPFKGIFIDELASDSLDSDIINFIDSGMFESDNNRMISNEGLASISFDLENKTATVTLNSKDYKWSDGHPVTIDDYIFAFEGIGHKDYTGSRYGSRFKNIVGMAEYHAGEATSISGLEKLDDYSVKMHFKSMAPSMKISGGQISRYIMPKHIYKDIPLSEWESSPYTRGKEHVGLGPFKIESIVGGESIKLVPNEYYYRGKPKVAGAVLEVVSPQNIVSEMNAGHYDIADMPEDQLPTYENYKNISLIGKLESAFDYVAFRLGHYDTTAKKNVADPNAKMKDKAVRQAMGYALNTEEIGKSLFHNTKFRANSIIPTVFSDLNDGKTPAGYNYDPEKAKKLLADAGYKDTDGDGLVENPNGEKFTINFAAPSGSEAATSQISQYLAWWKEVGLDVQLYTGRTLEANLFYEKLESDDQAIDVFAGSWGMGYDPDPTSLYGEDAKYNFGRYVSDKNTELLAKLVSTDAFDDAKRIAFFKEWQEFANDEAFAIPTLYSRSVVAVNKRVKYYDVITGSKKRAYNMIELTAENPVENK